MNLFWLSFADGSKPKGTQFLGACVVEAPSFADAIQVAWAHGCNPGGECLGREIHSLRMRERLFDQTSQKRLSLGVN